MCFNKTRARKGSREPTVPLQYKEKGRGRRGTVGSPTLDVHILHRL